MTTHATPSPAAAPAEAPSDQLDAARYRALRRIGVAPGGSLHLDRGHVMVATNLDAYADYMLSAKPGATFPASSATESYGTPAGGRYLSGKPVVAIVTNGTMRHVPHDEPVFLIRGQDAVGGDAVRVWADLAEASGAGPDIVRVAREHAAKMDAWPTKKVADLPEAAHVAR